MALRLTKDLTVTTTDIVTTSTSSPIDVSRAKIISLQSVVDVNTPSAATFVDAGVNTTTDIITTQAAHGFNTTGLKVAATTSGSLPGGLSATDYYVIIVSTTEIKLASSLANALLGTPVNITTAAGGGTHTLTPAAIGGASLTLQKSNNYDPIYNSTGTWDAVESATSISADGNIWISDIDPEYKWARLSFTLTAGRLSASTQVVVKEDI